MWWDILLCRWTSILETKDVSVCDLVLGLIMLWQKQVQEMQIIVSCNCDWSFFSPCVLCCLNLCFGTRFEVHCCFSSECHWESGFVGGADVIWENTYFLHLKTWFWMEKLYFYKIFNWRRLVIYSEVTGVCAEINRIPHVRCNKAQALILASGSCEYFSTMFLGDSDQACLE